MGNSNKRKRWTAEAASGAVNSSSKVPENNSNIKKDRQLLPAKKKQKQNGNNNAKQPQQNAQSETKVVIKANSNWMALKAKIQKKDAKHSSGEKKHDLDVHAHKQRAKELKQQKRKAEKTAEWIDNSTIVAMDCEMVGVGLSGKTSVLARCSIVDYNGEVLYDKHVRPVEKVTDFRTHVSGIRSRSLKHAIPFAQCLKEVGKLLKDKIVVGHALKNDFQALMFSPPKHLIRDTAHYRPYMRRKMNGTKLYPKALRQLAEEVLGLEIQSGEHDSVEDARATLALYKREQYAWEKYLRTNKSVGSLVGLAPALPEKNTKTVKNEILQALDEEEADSELEYGSGAAMITEKKKVIIPDSKELSIMEYAE